MTMTAIPPANRPTDIERWTPAPFQTLSATYPTHYPRLLAFVERLRGRDEADDVVQETMVLYMERLQSWEPGSPEEEEIALLTIARDISIQRRRRRQHRRTLVERFLPALRHAPPADRDLQSEEIARVIAELAGQLPPRMREVFLLSYDCDLGWAAIGSMLGTGASNASSTYARACKHLRDGLAARGIDPTDLRGRFA